MALIMELKDVKRLSELARIDISDNEATELLKDMSSILNYVGEIKEAATEEILPEVEALKNVMREDGIPHESGKHSKDILAEVPKTEKEYVRVKQILG